MAGPTSPRRSSAAPRSLWAAASPGRTPTSFWNSATAASYLPVLQQKVAELGPGLPRLDEPLLPGQHRGQILLAELPLRRQAQGGARLALGLGQPAPVQVGEAQVACASGRRGSSATAYAQSVSESRQTTRSRQDRTASPA